MAREGRLPLSATKRGGEGKPGFGRATVDEVRELFRRMEEDDVG